MRIAALSDIHGNVWALEAALADVRLQGVDVVVNLGDILSGPLEPAATADVLTGLHLPTIAGNHERQLLACARGPGGPSDRFAFEHTTERHRTWLASLPGKLVLDEDVLLCHGTPASDTTYFLEEVDAAGIHPRGPEDVERLAAGVAQRLVLCGHSHLARACALRGGRRVVNAGSVGLQAYTDEHPFPHAVENGGPELRYVVCSRAPDGGWRVELRRVPYDHAAASRTARRNGREDWARWLETGHA